MKMGSLPNTIKVYKDNCNILGQRIAELDRLISDTDNSAEIDQYTIRRTILYIEMRDMHHAIRDMEEYEAIAKGRMLTAG